MLAIAESKRACRRHPIGPIPEVRHLNFPLGLYIANDAKYEEGPEERATALLVAGKSNVHHRHATPAAREPGGRAALVFNPDWIGLTELEKEVQEHFQTAIKAIRNTCG